jgi:hypothetical protein
MRRYAHLCLIMHIQLHRKSIEKRTVPLNTLLSLIKNKMILFQFKNN